MHMSQHGNLPFLQLTFFKKMWVTGWEIICALNAWKETKCKLMMWSKWKSVWRIAMLRAKWQEATACVNIILYLFIASLLLYWRMNPWTRACSSVSLLFKITFDHPPSNYRIWSGRDLRKCPPPSVFWYRCMLIVSVIPGNVMNLTWIFSRTTPNLGGGNRRWV